METIFSNPDFRQVLTDELGARCAGNPRYSQRAFARDLGIQPHRLSLILRRKEGISRQRACEVARRMGLTRDEIDYFADLVESEHGRSLVSRQAAKSRLGRRVQRKGDKSHSLAIEGNRTNETLGFQELPEDRFRSIADWYHLGILELARVRGFRGDPRWISRCLGITEAEARLALERLTRLGLATQRGRRFRVAREDIAVPSSAVPSAAIRTFHLRLLERASQALISQSPEVREVNTTLLAIKRKDLPAIRERIKAFWQNLNGEFGSNLADDLYCVSVQAFQLSSRDVLDSSIQSLGVAKE